MIITVKRMESGYYHIRGRGPCNWAQPPHWPCSERVLRAHAFPEASEEFLKFLASVARSISCSAGRAHFSRGGR